MINQNIETQPELIYLLVQPKNRHERRSSEMEFNRISQELNGLMNLEIDFCNEVLRTESPYSYAELYKDLKDFSSRIFAKLENKKLFWYGINQTYFVEKYKPVETI